MKYSLSFLATDRSQLPPLNRYGNTAVEAVLFNSGHISTDNIKQTWENIGEACRLYGPENVTFHFPMNDCDYTEDRSIYKVLQESYVRAADLGLRGVVVHSNRIATCKVWNGRSVGDEQKRIFELLVKVRSGRQSSATWLGLENMPLVGNDGYDTDPLFCTAQDFVDLPKEIGVVWDACHATASQYFIELLGKGLMPAELFVREPETSDFDVQKIAHRIVHVHFAGSKGYNDLANRTNVEGVLPSESDLAESVYEQAFENLNSLLSADTVVNFEVQETDYKNRLSGPKIIGWAKQIK